MSETRRITISITNVQTAKAPSGWSRWGPVTKWLASIGAKMVAYLVLHSLGLV